jgi:hypothetical protein
LDPFYGVPQKPKPFVAPVTYQAAKLPCSVVVVDIKLAFRLCAADRTAIILLPEQLNLIFDSKSECSQSGFSIPDFGSFFNTPLANILPMGIF